MNIYYVLGVFTASAFFGIISGIFSRLIRNKTEIRHLISTFLLFIEFLFIYPIKFPIFALREKDSFADICAKGIRRAAKEKGEKALPENEIKKMILNKLNLRMVLYLWAEILINISRDYENYIESNISLAQQIAFQKSYASSKEKEKGKNQHFSSILNSALEIIENIGNIDGMRKIA